MNNDIIKTEDETMPTEVMYNVVVTINRLPLENKFGNFSQKKVFNELCYSIFKHSDNPPKNWTAEELEDPHKEYTEVGNKEHCLNYLNAWEKMGGKFIKKHFATFDKLKNYLFNIGIFLDIEIKRAQ